MKKILTLAVSVFIGLSAFAQTARLQIIHNSADAAAATVDVYVNGNLFLEDVAFRTATAFTDVPSGVPLTIDLTPPNTSLSSSVFNKTVTLADGETYVAIANGIVSGSGYTPASPFDIYVYALGRETSNNINETAVLVFHGATDAPTVDVVERGVGAGLIIDDLSYNEFTTYLDLPTADFTLDVRTENTLATVASYSAPLATLNAGGAALVVVASGFLNPANNSNGPAFGLYAALPTGGALLELPSVAATNGAARVQVIHNSADAAAAEVDVYINGTLVFDDFAFRTASAFTDLPSLIDIEVAIAPSTSTSVGDAIATFDYVLADEETYIIVANGIVSPSGYSPATPFDLYVYTTGREAAAGGTANTDLLVFHGATDAPTVDAVEVAAGAGTVVDDISYGEFQGYLPLINADYALQVRDETGTVVVAAYEAPLASLGLQGGAGVVLASGFLNPANNSDGPAFGLFVALPTGGALVPLPNSTARVQVIHNSADAAAAEVDVYINDVLEIDNFAFRTATPFIDLNSDVNNKVSIAPANSTSVADAIANFNYTLDRNETYVIVANGIVSPTGYSPATPFDLYVFNPAQEAAASSGNTDVLVFHGATDAPTVDVAEVEAGAGTVVDDLSYGAFAGYLPLATADYALQVQDETGSVTVAAYEAPLATLGLQDAAAVVLASGFLNPANNSDGPAFGLFAALPTGGALVPLPNSTARVQVIHNSADAAAAEVDVYINDVLEIDNFAFRTATPFIDLNSDVNNKVSIAPANSTSVADAIANFNYTLDRNETYVIVANGIVSPTGYSPATPFDLYVFNPAQEAAASSGNTDVLVFHGATDAPTVDVVETLVGAGTIVNDLSYGEFEGYLELPTNDYEVQVRDETGTTTVACYQAPLASLNQDGNALIVLASGFLNPANNSNGEAFGLFAALPTGGALVALPACVQVNTTDLVLNNAISIYPNPVNSNAVSVTANENIINTVVYDLAGAELANANHNTTSALVNLPANISTGVYMIQVKTESNTFTRRIVVE